jgi:membrane-bound lytic murein transglycosylase D
VAKPLILLHRNMLKPALNPCLAGLLAISLGACQHDMSKETDSGLDEELLTGLETSDTRTEDDGFDAFGQEIEPISDGTVWTHIQAGFQLDESDLKRRAVQTELKWFAEHKDYIDRVMKRSEPFLYYILKEAEERNLPTELVLLPIVESAFQPFAYSHGRAAGIWQFIPSTGRSYGLKQNWWYDGRRDIHASTKAALKYLNNLNKMFDGDWMLALAAYNSGSGTVKRAIRKNKKASKPTDFWHLKLPKETRAYVPKLLALKALISDPEKYEITLRCIPYAPGFKQVDAGSQIDLALAAELADMDLDTLYQYNPAYNRWTTSPEGPHTLLLPADAAESFEQNLASVPDSERVRWKRHRIKEGETLSHIAVKYNTTVKHLREVNNLRKNTIRAGKNLLIPVASRDRSDYKLSAGQRKKSIQSKSRGKKRISHIVQNNESFWTISRRYGVDMHKLAKWNGMAIRDPLRKGQTLVIWKQNDPSSTQLSQRKPSNSITKISYTVKSGDSLSRIASRYRVTVNDLHRWNSLEGKYLQPGQRIKVYIDITEQAS